MALFQPTNIIPSTLIGQGTVDVNDNMEISWQVNGNSAMTAFQIDFYQNDTVSTYVTSTNKISDGIPTGGFYGTDRFGNPQFFTWNAQKSWAQWSMLLPVPFTNGNEYKFKIIQWFKATNSVVSCRLSSVPTSGTRYYFTVPTGAYQGAVVAFIASSNITAGATFYYSFTNSECWVESGDRTIVLNGVLDESGTVPSDATQLAGATIATLNYMFVAQTSSSIIITRDSPTLTLYQTDENYQNPIVLTDTLATSIVYFQATYHQGQDDAIRWIRWQVAQANNGVAGEILADTGDIYTPTLNFEFNGFFNGQQYAIRCMCQSESGQSYDTDWIYFNINIENQAEYSGNFTAQCVSKENAALLEWEGIEVIVGKYTPPAGSQSQYIINNGSVTLPANSSITWQRTKEDDVIPFDNPWTAVWKGQLSLPAQQATTITINGEATNNYFNTIRTSAFSPSGKLLVLGGLSQNEPDGRAFCFIVNDDMSIGQATELTINGVAFTRAITSACFSPDGSLLILIESPTTTSSAYIFSVNGTTLSYQSTIELKNIYTVSFSNDSKFLVIGGGFTGRAKIYSVSGSTLSFISDITKNGTAIYDNVYSSAYSPTSDMFVLGGVFSGQAAIFTLNTLNGSTAWVADIKGEGGGGLFNGYAPIQRADFSPDGQLLVLGADLKYVSVFTVNNTTIEWAYDITGKGEQNFNNAISTQAFSPDGEWLLLGGYFDGGASIFRMNEGAEYVADVSFSPPGIYTTSISFSPTNSKHFVITQSRGSSVAYIPDWLPQGDLFQILPQGIELSRDNFDNFVLSVSNTSTNLPIPPLATSAAIIITPTSVYAYYYADEYLLSSLVQPLSYIQQSVESVTVNGGESGATINSMSLYQGDGSNIIPLYQTNPDFEPVWNDEQYQLYMTANFNNNIEGGTGTATGIGFRIYRQEVGKTALTPIATVSSTTNSLKDYGIVSRKAYQYSIYAYDNNGAFMSAVAAENTIATNFKNYSLLVCDYDQTNDEYHVRKQYLFALNLSDGSVGNNNSPTLNANFTQYPTRMPSTQNYASGTLSGLIGAIYTVPALIEQIGQYKYTAKPSTLDYFDSVDLEQELYGLSTAPYQLFLRDLKGRLRMIATSAPITMTTNLKQRQQSITISLPWVEVGDASDVTIIQTPDDYGWNNDNQVLDVQLDVDVATGELSAQYPFPYNGTKFYLTGVNQETLTAKTPLGVSPAQFDLSDTAEQPNDGELIATVKVSSETSSNNNQ